MVVIECKNGIGGASKGLWKKRNWQFFPILPVQMGGKFLPEFVQGGKGEGGAQTAFFPFGQFLDDIALEINYHASSAVADAVVVRAGTVDKQQVSFIFNGAGLCEGAQDLLPAMRPVGDDNQAVIQEGSVMVAVPAAFRKAEVVAYLRKQFPTLTVENSFLFSWGKISVFIAHAEKMPFVVVKCAA